jgi:hypothetical protein
MTIDTSLVPARRKAIQKKIDHQLRQTALQMLRMVFRQRRRQMNNACVEAALEYFLDNDNVVESYMLHQSVTDLCERENIERDPEQSEEQCVLPLDEALWAAERAMAAVGDASELDRELAYAAALMAPAGIFMMAHPMAEFHRTPGWTLRQERSYCRRSAMELPLSCLRQCAGPEVERQMRYLSEQLDPTVPVPPQWQALKSAVQQSMTRIQAMW